MGVVLVSSPAARWDWRMMRSDFALALLCNLVCCFFFVYADGGKGLFTLPLAYCGAWVIMMTIFDFLWLSFANHKLFIWKYNYLFKKSITTCSFFFFLSCNRNRLQCLVVKDRTFDMFDLTFDLVKSSNWVWNCYKNEVY